MSLDFSTILFQMVAKNCHYYQENTCNKGFNNES